MDDLKLILQKLDELKSGIDELRTDVSDLKTDVNELKSDVKELDRKTGIILDQTAGLTEFQTQVTDDLGDIKKEVSFIGHKEYQNEKDVYSIKKQLEIIK